MPCSCSTTTMWTVKRADGTTAEYRTQTEAAADVLRNGGSYAPVN